MAIFTGFLFLMDVLQEYESYRILGLVLLLLCVFEAIGVSGGTYLAGSICPVAMATSFHSYSIAMCTDVSSH